MTRRFTFLVRRTPSHAVVAHVLPRETPQGVRLELRRVTPDAGPLPDVSDLIGQRFVTRADLRAEIKARMAVAANADRPAPVPGADRVRAHAGRMQARGLKQVREWIPVERETEFREIARKMRDGEI
jgi:hypothetical protein